VAFRCDEDWELAVWGKNVANEQYVVQGIDFLNLGFGERTYNAPRTYGITLSRRFE